MWFDLLLQPSKLVDRGNFVTYPNIKQRFAHMRGQTVRFSSMFWGLVLQPFFKDDFEGIGFITFRSDYPVAAANK